MFGIGMLELSVILVIALLVFGPKKLPEIGRGLGKGIKEFKKAGQELTNAIEEEPTTLVHKSPSHDCPEDNAKDQSLEK